MAPSRHLCGYHQHPDDALTEASRMDSNQKEGAVRSCGNYPEVYKMGIIGIPRLDDGSKQFGKALASIHRMPTTVFLGLFAYLIVSYSPMSSFNVLLLSALVYIILVSAISVIRAATESTLTFADPTNRRIIPMAVSYTHLRAHET